MPHAQTAPGNHAPKALGNIVSLSGDLPEGSPPTSYAAHAVLQGNRGSVLAFAGLTLLRSLLIAPGLAIAGIRGKKLFYGSLAGSGVISGVALAYVYMLDRKKKLEVEIGEAQITSPTPQSAAQPAT
jgi:hypothetical protein